MDLYVLKRALEATHPGSEGLFEAMLGAYLETAKDAEKVSKKLGEVEKRGRKRLAFG